MHTVLILLTEQCESKDYVIEIYRRIHNMFITCLRQRIQIILDPIHNMFKTKNSDNFRP